MSYQGFINECTSFDNFINNIENNHYQKSIDHFNSITEYINENYHILPFDNNLYLTEKFDLGKFVSDVIDKILDFIAKISNMLRRFWANFTGFFKKNRVKLTNEEIEKSIKFVNKLSASSLAEVASAEQLKNIHERAKFLYPSINEKDVNELQIVDDDKEITKIENRNYPQQLPDVSSKEFSKWWDLVKTKLIQYLNQIKTIDVNDIPRFQSRSLTFVQSMIDFYASWTYLICLMMKFLNITADGILIYPDNAKKINSMIVASLGDYNQKSSSITSEVRERTSYKSYLLGKKYENDFKGICQKFIMYNRDMSLVKIDDDFIKDLSKVSFDKNLLKYFKDLDISKSTTFKDNKTEGLKTIKKFAHEELKPDVVNKNDKTFEDMVNALRKVIVEVLESNDMVAWLALYQDKRDNYIKKIKKIKSELYINSSSNSSTANKNIYQTLIYSSKKYNECIKLSKIDLVLNVTLHKYGQLIIENNIKPLIGRKELYDLVINPEVKTNPISKKNK